MPIYKGSTKQGEIYYKGVQIKEVYKGSTLVYQNCKYQLDITDYEYTNANKELVLTKYIGSETDVTVPNV